ncbi:MAG: hypothetical protein HXS53_08350 [Theionarchaea archaeon]|nr:hypothetical protein [Theionarchaea archaeon]
MKNLNHLEGETLLLMGSKAFPGKELPSTICELIDKAITDKMVVIVGEAPGACRLFQDFLESRQYDNVIVGHARSLRYNAGNWKTVQYGSTLKDRERNMIEACSSAIIIWHDKSGVIAENLELLKELGKPTYIYEYSSKTQEISEGWLDPNRTYDPYKYWKESMRRRKGERDQKNKRLLF